MKLLSLLFFLTLSTPLWALSWSFQKINVSGEKEIVLKLTSRMQENYKTEAGERLINTLSDKKINLKLIESDRFYYKSGAERILYIDQLGSVDELDLFIHRTLLNIISEYMLQYDERISIESFLEEKKNEIEFEEDWSAYPFIQVKGSPLKRLRLISYLEKINNYEIGQKLLSDMKACQKELLIYDDKSSLSGGGYTGAVRTSTNVFKPGIGEDAYIRFRFDQPDDGAHLVGATVGQIKFLYIDNLYHELVHAKHTMCGTMSKNNAEAQAISEENDFRSSREETNQWPRRDHRQYEDGEQVWFGLFI